jgi:hypothetical protein
VRPAQCGAPDDTRLAFLSADRDSCEFLTLHSELSQASARFAFPDLSRRTNRYNRFILWNPGRTLDPLRERILRNRLDIISEHGVAVRKPGEDLVKQQLTASPREVAADLRQVR